MASTSTLLYSIFGSLGLFTNGFAIFILLRLQNRFNSPNLLIFNQCVVDFLTSFFSIIQFVDKFNNPLPESPVLAAIVCSKYFFWSCIFTSTGNLVVLTIDRYCAVIHSLKYNHVKNYKWVKCAALVTPWICGFTFILYWVAIHRVVDGVCFQKWPSVQFQKLFGFLNFFYIELAPLAIMLFVYVRIFNSLKTRVGENSTTRNEHGNTARRMNIIKTMLIVGVIYMICWTPNQIAFLNFTFGGQFDFNGIFYYVVVVLSLFNSCVNPIIYTFKYKDFQEGLKKTLVCLLPRDTT
ncbi:galanin receptor 2b-like [Antedon mediterranea]|uniref:galanin receptor 2b-like n=1 Tax=Antedon mediterranea TaxID=105859 RepID=UPI003AF52EEE